MRWSMFFWLLLLYLWSTGCSRLQGSLITMSLWWVYLLTRVCTMESEDLVISSLNFSHALWCPCHNNCRAFQNIPDPKMMSVFLCQPWTQNCHQSIKYIYIYMEMVHELVSLFIFVSEAENKIQCNQLEIECSTWCSCGHMFTLVDQSLGFWSCLLQGKLLCMTGAWGWVGGEVWVEY